MIDDLPRRPPALFWIASALLLFWALVGVVAFYAHVTLEPAVLARMSAYDRDAYRALPPWFVWVFALATIPALAGAVALLLRSALARLLYLLSLIGIIVQFGWVFGATDLIAVKGAEATVPLPATILVIGILALWFAGMARRRGWLH